MAARMAQDTGPQFFDGVDLITVIATDASPLLDLYTGWLGFTVVEYGPVVRPDDWRAAFDLPESGAMSAWMLGKPGSPGGWIRVVEDRSAAPVKFAATIAAAGPHALDFYVRDVTALHSRMSAAGAAFRSPPLDYTLFGTSNQVRECLLEAPGGLVHALVGYLPEQHRCVLSRMPDAAVSEAVAVVHVVPDIGAALASLTELLGASVYLDQAFTGPEIERLMALPAGTEFRMALLRGPGRRNARLEVIQQTPSAPPDSCGALSPARVILGCSVPALDTLHQRLLNAGQGQVSQLTRLTGPGAASRSFAWTTGWGATFEFSDRDGSERRGRDASPDH
jgi:catechol 2,3-dioxygenase-like lactoylglutathione lyase family enzyme